MAQRPSLLQMQQVQQQQNSMVPSISNQSISPMSIGNKSPPMGQQPPMANPSVPSSGPNPSVGVAATMATATSSNAAPRPAAPSSGGAACGNSGGGTPSATRVVPVSISPGSFAPPYTDVPGNDVGGGVSDAALIYIKYALRSIVDSLNAREEDSASTGNSKGRVYTVRDLSTCVGAWDLNIPASVNKRQKTDTGNGVAPDGIGSSSSADTKDGNADTAFQFYYERSCPILLDARQQRQYTPNSPSAAGGPVPFCVEDFGGAQSVDGVDDCDGGGSDLPVVAGAVVLTYGADLKFTGGIGEEGVLTKVIVEFFCDEFKSAVHNQGGEEGEERRPDEDATVEAEEQTFARVDGSDERSGSLIRAALHALTPHVKNGAASTVAPDSSPKKLTSSSDDGEYIPTIWSGNTDRIYQYCLLGNFDDNGKERASKRLCVAIQKKKKDFDSTTSGFGEGKGPAKGVCRITLTLSPISVLAKKKQMAMEREGSSPTECQSSSEVHRKIRESLRTLRSPKLTTVSSNDDVMSDRPIKRRRKALRRRSVTQSIDHTMIVVGVRCQHELLLDADEVGKIYVNGALAADCSKSSSHVNDDTLPAHILFGVDFSLPSTPDGKLPNRKVLEMEYGALLVDALIDAGQRDADVAGKLLMRLVTGNTRGDKDDDYDEPLSMKNGEKGMSRSGNDDRYHDQLPRMKSNYSIPFDDISLPCLESMVLSSTVVDPVGIGAKAVGTKFQLRYGAEAFPCEMGTNDASRLRRILGAQKVAVPVPRRARDVLLRGAYPTIDRMATFLWGGFLCGQGRGASSSSWDGDHSDAMRAAAAMEGAIKLLRKAGCRDVKPNKIRLVARKTLEPPPAVEGSTLKVSSAASTSVSKLRCWYDSDSGTYNVSDGILFVDGGNDLELENDDDGSIDKGSPVSTAGINSKPGTDELSKAGKSPQSNGKQDGAADKKSPGDDAECTADVNRNGKDGSNDKGSDNMDVGNQKETDDTSQGKANDGELKHVSAKDVVVIDEKSKSKVVGDDEKENVTTESLETEITSTKSTSKPAKNECARKNQKPRPASAEDAAYLLAFYIAKEHPDDMVLERFVTCNRS